MKTYKEEKVLREKNERKVLISEVTLARLKDKEERYDELTSGDYLFHLDTSVLDLPISNRNALKKAGIDTLGDLVTVYSRGSHKILKIKGIGDSQMEQIERLLYKQGKL